MAPRRRGSTKRDLELGLGIRDQARIRDACSGRGRGKHFLFSWHIIFDGFSFCTIYRFPFPFTTVERSARLSMLPRLWHLFLKSPPQTSGTAPPRRYGASACLAGPAASSRGVVCDLDPPRTGTGQPRTSRSRPSSPKTTATAASVDLGIRADFGAQVVRGRRRAHRGPRA